jgi:type II secretory pathway pseudopilin PulG
MIMVTPRKGLTLVEVVVAALMLAIAVLGLSSSMISSISLNQDNQEMTNVAFALRHKMEEIRSAAINSFDNVFALYGPNAGGPGIPHSFPIYPKFGIVESPSTELKPPPPFLPANGGTWPNAGRVTIVTNEQVTAPDLPMLMEVSPIPDEMFGGTYIGNTNITLDPAFVDPNSFKLWYVIVSAVWESPTTGRVRRMSYHTILGDRL